MSAVLGTLRLPHWIALGAVVALLAGGLPGNWFGLAGAKLTAVERLRSCMLRHRVELGALVANLGNPNSLLSESPRAREHAVHVAERHGELQRREANAIVACARTVTG